MPKKIRLYAKFIPGKNVRYLAITLFFGILVILTGCAGSGRLTSPTMTAQAERAIRQATQIARSSRLTEIAEETRLQATAQAARAKVENWPVVLEDLFDLDTDVWILGEDEDASLAKINWKIESGVYRWEAEAYDAFVWWVTPDAPDLSDFLVSVDIRRLGSDDVGEFGLVFRQDDTRGYYTFEINNLAEFGVFFYDYEAQTWYTVVDWQPSSSIRADWSNQLSVLAQGEQFYFYINDERVAEALDGSSSQGSVGLMIGLSNPGEATVWEFDNFKLLAPEIPVIETPTPTP
jgi:hypothetical protein